MTVPETFQLQGVVHLIRSTERRAADLAELRAGIADAAPRTLFYHAVQCHLRHFAEDEAGPDDFSAWVRGVLQNVEAAERLSFAVLRSGNRFETLRETMLSTLDRAPSRGAVPPGSEFEFLSAESLPLPVGPPIGTPQELMEELTECDASVWFWNLVEVPWLDNRPPPAGVWLRARGETKMADTLEDLASSGRALGWMRRHMLGRWRRRQLGSRVAEMSGVPEAERREAAQRIMARLVRRVKPGNGR